MLSIISRQVISLAFVIAVSAVEFMPENPGDNNAVICSFSSMDGTSSLLGISHRILADKDNKKLESFNIWLAGCSADGKCLWYRPLDLPKDLQINDLSHFDSICTIAKNGQLAVVLPTDKENLYEVQYVAMSAKESENKPERIRFRMPAGYRFGCGGRGSGGIYGSALSGFYALGLGVDGKSVVGLSGRTIDSMTVQFEHKTTQKIDIINCVDGKAFWEIGDIDQFGGGERRIEGAIVKKGSVPVIVAKGKFGSVVKNGNGYLLIVNRNPIFPKAEYVIYDISADLNWISTTDLQRADIAIPYSISFLPVSAALFGVIGIGGVSEVKKVRAKENEISTETMVKFTMKGTEGIKGVVLSRDGEILSIITNAREMKRNNGRVVSVRNTIYIVKPD